MNKFIKNENSIIRLNFGLLFVSFILFVPGIILYINANANDEHWPQSLLGFFIMGGSIITCIPLSITSIMLLRKKINDGLWGILIATIFIIIFLKITLDHSTF
jgi:hypothetical protein